MTPRTAALALCFTTTYVAVACGSSDRHRRAVALAPDGGDAGTPPPSPPRKDAGMPRDAGTPPEKQGPDASVPDVPDAAPQVSIADATVDAADGSGCLAPNGTLVFADPLVEAAVHAAVGSTAPLTPALVAGLTQLTVAGTGVTSLEGVQCLHALTNLSAVGNAIQSVEPLRNLTALTQLSLAGDQIADVSPLANLKNLQILILESNQITDASPLMGLDNMKGLQLQYNKIADISPFASFNAPAELDLGGNGITDIAPLATRTNLASLWLYGNSITDITPLHNLTQLTELYINGNPVTDLSPISTLTNLVWLWMGPSLTTFDAVKNMNVLNDVLISGSAGGQLDLSAFANLPNLANFRMDDCQDIKSFTPLTTAPILQNLTFYGDNLSDITFMASIPLLSGVDIETSNVSDLSPLASATNLEGVNISSSPVTDLTPLANNLHFGSGATLDVSGDPIACATQVTNIQKLEGRGVTVTTPCSVPDQ